MKKIFLIFIMSFITLTGVNAKEYYSDYGEFSDYGTERIEANDTILPESIIKYKYYNETKIGDYYYKNNIPANYFLDNSKFITKESSWTTKYPELVEDRIINEKTVYNYQDMKKVRYIHIHKIKGPEDKIYIPELEIIINNNKIDYDIICDNCSNDFNKYVKDGITSEYNNFVNNDGHIIIDLKDNYNIDDISINMYLYNKINDQNYYWISFNNSKTIEKEYFRGIYINYYVCENMNDIKSFNYNISTWAMKNPEYEEPVVKDEYIEPSKYQKVTEEKFYQTIDRLYYYYKIDQNYSDYMSSSTNKYPIKSNISKEFFRFKKRDKVEIQDEIVITEKNVNLLEFIKSTNNNIEINHNIDYTKNGIYNVSYKLPFKTYDVSVLVNIPSNDKKVSSTTKIKTNKVDSKKNNTKKDYIISKSSLIGVALLTIMFVVLKVIRRKKSIEK